MAKNMVLVKDGDLSAAFEIARRSQQATIDLYGPDGKGGTQLTECLNVSLTYAEELYVKLLEDGYRIAY